MRQRSPAYSLDVAALERGSTGPVVERDAPRLAVPAIAAGLVVAAAVDDPAEPGAVAVLAVAALSFGVWAARPVSPLVLGVGVLAPVLVVKWWTGALDPALFLVCLLAAVVTAWERPRPAVAVVLGAAVAMPFVVILVRPGDTEPLIWTVGIVFPAVMGGLFRRQEELRTQLGEAHRLLTEQRASEERRRIARDVHDLVGHGLSAVLVQVAGARHVLHRDPGEAESALRTAEEVGRRSLSELRSTVALLRADGEGWSAAPPRLEHVENLVAEARRRGLTVERIVTGSHDRVGETVGVTLYRIAQEALLNSARHAPSAKVTVTTAVREEQVELNVRTQGPVPAARPGAPEGYGLVGMRERAAAVGGALEAGPAPGGWSVRCVAPLQARPQDGGHRA